MFEQDVLPGGDMGSEGKKPASVLNVLTPLPNYVISVPVRVKIAPVAQEDRATDS